MMGKESACQAENMGSIPGLGRSNSSLEEEMAIHSSSLDWILDFMLVLKV